MPVHLPPTMAEREAELAALQSAFDEYIASSRELEEELDAELAKMRKSISVVSAGLLLRTGCRVPLRSLLTKSHNHCRRQAEILDR